MNRLLMFLAAFSAVGVSTTVAAPYWITYDADDGLYPEEQGWMREYGDENGDGQGGAERWFEDGALVLDGLRDIAIYDSYSISRSVDPDPGELFMIRWRLKVDQVSHYQDPVVGVFSDDSWFVGVAFSESRVFNIADLSMSAAFEPNEFHCYELRSYDMRGFDLLIDGRPKMSGDFVPVISSSEVAWGDGIYGSASLSRWDYFEFGVVPVPGPPHLSPARMSLGPATTPIPEPTSALALGLLGLAAFGRRRRRV